MLLYSISPVAPCLDCAIVDLLLLHIPLLCKVHYNKYNKISGFNTITTKLKEMYQMITLGGDAELELVDSLDPFTEGIIFRLETILLLFCIPDCLCDVIQTMVHPSSCPACLRERRI